MPLKITRRSLLALGAVALSGTTQANLPDDAVEPSAPAARQVQGPRPPKTPGFALERADLVCTNSMGPGGYLYRLKLLTNGPFTPGFNLAVRLRQLPSQAVVGTWPLAGTPPPGWTTTFQPPGGVVLTGGQSYRFEVLYGTPQQVWAPFTRVLTAPVCGKWPPDKKLDDIAAPMPIEQAR